MNVFAATDIKSVSPQRETLTDRTQAAPDRPKSAPLGLKSALATTKSTLPFEDAASPHSKTTRSRRKIAPHRIKSTTDRREAAPSHIHLTSTDVQDAPSWGPDFFHQVKSARIRSERHTYGADAANEQAQMSHDDPTGAHDDTKTATPGRVMSAARPEGLRRHRGRSPRQVRGRP